jgi:hypothetical protein
LTVTRTGFDGVEGGFDGVEGGFDDAVWAASTV